MGRIVPLNENPQIIYGRQESLFTSAVSTKFRFSDSLNYPNGNLQDHAPWAYAFTSCPTLIGFINGGGFLMQGDTVNNDWSAIRVSSAPIVARYRFQAQWTGTGSNLPFRGGFGFLISTTKPTFTLVPSPNLGWFGWCIRRIVTAGAINVTAGGFSQFCGTADNATISASNPGVGSTLGMIVTRSGTQNFSVDYQINGVTLLTRTEVCASANFGGQPAFSCSGFAGGGGAMLFNNVQVREL